MIVFNDKTGDFEVVVEFIFNLLMSFIQKKLLKSLEFVNNIPKKYY